jgi:hypothetical protein
MSTGAVPHAIASAVVLSVFEFVRRLVDRSDGPPVSLLADALDLSALRHSEEQFPPAFPGDSLLNGLHESYVRRRMSAGEARPIAYLHAISDVAHFLHPPTAMSACETQVPP